MKPLHLSLRTLAGLVLLTWGVNAAPEAKPPSIVVETGRSAQGSFTLAGPDARQQLLVTGNDTSGKSRDLTSQAKYVAMPEGVVAIDPTGLVTPLKDGDARIEVQAPGSAPVTVSVTVSHLAEELPIDFSSQVAPIFNRLGCNSGGCHGKAGGQNGFRLSLFGFEPAEDHESVVRESRGRRIAVVAPESSLLLRKASAQMAHGGGKRLEKGSPEYALLLRWIQQGALNDQPGTPAVQRIEVLPRERLLDRTSSQQLVVVAHRADGSTVDVTRLAQFEPNQPEMATASPTGLVTVKQMPGSVAIMARYQAHVAVFRAIVPLGAPVGDLPPARNFIDELVFKQLKELGLPPSPPCNDATFLRRVTIDIAGRLPTKDETVQFLAAKNADKYEQAVDRLLAGGDYADYFANKWCAVLRNRRASEKDDPKPTVAFHGWIRESLQQNKPYDQFVREILTAAGEAGAQAPVTWYREVKEMTAQMEDTAQLFLAQRIQCARCHHHPLEKWSQEDYHGLAAFFSRLEIKEAVAPKKTKKGEPDAPGQPFRIAFKPGKAQAVNPKTSKAVKPRGLGGPVLDLAAEDDPRHKLVDWMVARDNPFFARALVNRYWKHFLGRGLVDPEDDMRVTNPASNPALLDALAKHFTEHGYDLKDLVRTICTSQVYRLSATPNAHNAADRQNYSRFLPRRLNAEVLLDAIDTVTGSKTTFPGVPEGTRAVQLPDNQFDSYFLSAFGRPDSASACECERSSDSSLAQALHLFNSADLLGKISGRRIVRPAPPPDPKAKKPAPQGKQPPGPTGTIGGRIRELLADKRPDAEKVRDLYLIVMSREPTREETASVLAHIARKNGDLQTAYEDILWVLINTKEFLFSH